MRKMENKVKGTYYLIIEIVVGIAGMVVTVISIIVTLISIVQTTTKDGRQESNRHTRQR